MIQFYDLCRLCAQKKRNKVDLFTNNNNGECELLISKISVCLSVEVSRQDMLPKMICIDCQRAVEQFSCFRNKCHKAEERLNKMLALNLPNKVMVTRIKQECLETDYHESAPSQLRLDSSRRNEIIPNLKPVKHVKCEVDETDIEAECIPEADSSGADIIQIISEEIVNRHHFDDVKQPHIELISENYIEDHKEKEFNEVPEDNLYDVKNSYFNLQDQNIVVNEQDKSDYSKEKDQDRSVDPSKFIEVKMQMNENDLERVIVKKRSKPTRKDRNLKGVNAKRKKKKKDIVDSDTEIDEKYLLLNENETCDIDMEEMEAIIKKKSDPNATFSCDKCEKSFKFFKCLRKHRQLHNSELETYICDFCNDGNSKSFEFSSLKCLRNHMKKKHLSPQENKIPCPVCNKMLPSQGQLNSHCKKVHDTSGATCQICGKGFKNKTRLTDHLKVHQEDRPFVCDQCGQSFKWNNGLKVHMQSHKQEKNFLCSECGKKFAAKKNLIEHLNIHSGKRPHVCQHCNASFIQLSAYSKHLFIHNEELKIHKCDKCDKSFSHGYMLKQHMLQHSGLRPYECSECHHSFKSQSDLCSHSKIHQEKQYACSVCSRKFSRSKTLRDHMVRHTGIKHICPAPDCGRTYTQRFPLTKHFNKHHPNLVIINRMGGKKAHLSNKFNNEEISQDIDFIRYDYRFKDEIVLS